MLAMEREDKNKNQVKAGSHHFCLHCVATRSVYKMIWTHVRDAGIELFSIPASHTRVQIISYALPVVMRRKQK